jgi:TPR repeat protein
MADMRLHSHNRAGQVGKLSLTSLLILVSFLISSLFSVAVNADPAGKESDRGFEAYSRGDYTAAREIWLRAADNNNPSAQYNLGQMYRLGRGTKIDYQQAEKWYLLAAKQGHPAAQRNLGELFYFGKLGQQNYDEAFMWLTLAAINNDPRAQWITGLMFYHGQGVKKDLAKAYAWLALASDQQYESAIASKKHLRQELSKEQLKKAESLIAGFEEESDLVSNANQPADKPSIYRVQLGTYRTLNTAETALVALKKSMPKLLGGLVVQIEKTHLGLPQGILFRLQVGAFSDQRDAIELCGKIKRREHSCSVVKSN